jgi:PAS domain S-box-containing protein
MASEAELRERWLESILLAGAEKAELGVAVTQLHETGARQLFVNACGAELLGLSREEFLARPAFSGIVGSFREKLPEYVSALAGGRAVPPFDAEVRRSDGSLAPMEVAFAPVLWEGRRFAVTFFRDRTPRQAAESARMSSEARFRALVEGAPDGVVISRDGVILYANPAGVRLLGYDTPDELVGRSLATFLSPREIERMVRRIGEIRAGARLPAAEYRARRRDGAEIVAEITSLPIALDDGPAVIAFARDVTERAGMREQLARADRLASLGTLAAGVAHEINNPLTFMTLGVELCERRLESSGLAPRERAELLGILADVRAGAERVALVVRDLKTFSRATEDVPQVVDVSRTIEAATRIVAHRARHFAEVSVALPPLPPVRANAARLEQVFVNLLLNAVQAFADPAPGNRIEVVGSVAGADAVTIDVADNGPSIPSDVVDRIFDPFFTTKPVGEGTGLGLAIVHELVAQMGGSVMVVHGGERGARFRVRLPIASGGPALAARAEASPVTSPASRILVVDDEREVGAVIRRSLAPRHEVVAVTSVAGALELLAASPPFDAIVCDLAMPAGSGIDLYRVATRERPELERRFVLVTGGAVSRRDQAFLEAWPGPRLEKPFSGAEIEAALAAVLDAKPERSSG